MKKKGNFLGLAFSLATFIYILINIDWNIANETFNTIDYGLLIAAFCFYILNYFLRTMRFSIILGLEPSSFVHLFGVTNLYGMFLYLMPAKSGEVAFPILARNQLSVPITNSTATLISARIFDITTIALFLPAVLITFWDQIPSWIRIGSLVFVALVFFTVLGLFWFVRYNDRFAHKKVVNPESHKWIIKLWDAIYRVFASLKTIDQRNLYWRIWIITIAIWICVQANFFLIVLSLGYPLKFFQMIVVSIIMVPMTLLPIQGFANLGTHEIGWTAAFALFGYPQSTAINISVFSHVVFLFFVLILGLIGAILLKIGNTKVSQHHAS